MAYYSALWTSHRDPEFQRIKQSRQIAHRRLSMRVNNMEKELNRNLKKSRDEIRENMTTLEELEQEKEKRARHILATYLKVQKRKAAANSWTQRYLASLQKKLNSVAAPEVTESRPGVDIVTTRGTVTLKDFSTGPSTARETVTPSHPSAPQAKLTLPKILLTDTTKEAGEGGASKAGEGVATRAGEGGVSKAGGSGTSIAVGGVPSTTDDVINSVAVANNSTTSPGHQKVVDVSEGSQIKDTLKVPSVSRSRQSRKQSKHELQTQSGRLFSTAGLPGDGDRRSSMAEPLASNKKRLSVRGDVYVTFPFVYHSVGEKTCPRYSLFRECTDYDPYAKPDNVTDQRKLSMGSSHRGSDASLTSILSTSPRSKRGSLAADTPGGPLGAEASRRNSKRVSFANVAIALRAMQFNG